MSVNMSGVEQLAPYDDDDEEIQLMDMDGNNLQLDEPLIDTNTNVVEKKTEEKSMEKVEQSPILLVIEKLKVYLRDGPNQHHVEAILVDNKYYEFPTIEELTSIGIIEEKFYEILQSLNLTKEDFRTAQYPTGTSRPESLLVHGVNNMSTQEILNYFEEFEPIGIEWITDHSCNIFWHDTLSPLKLLSMKTQPVPSISHSDSTNSDQSIRPLKRKASSMPDDDKTNSIVATLPLGHWREGTFQLFNKSESEVKLYVRYTTLEDRKAFGAENRSEYYRQHGNPNYNNMTGLISRSKKRQLNIMKLNRFRDFKVVKPVDRTSTTSSIIEETTAAAAATGAAIESEDNITDSNVKFTVVLPPKKASAENDDNDDDAEEEHQSKRRRRRRQSWDSDEDDDAQRRKDTTHFTVTIDSPSKHARSTTNKITERSKSTKDNDSDHSTMVIDARQILERKRRNRN